MASEVVSRGFFSRILRGVLSPSERREVSASDRAVDEAFDNLRNDEEPRLRTWLEGDEELRLVLRATVSSIYQLIVDESEKGGYLEDTLPKIRLLIFRTVASSSLKAVVSEREAHSLG